jgi:membrane associated rhomboid family serine protease
LSLTITNIIIIVTVIVSLAGFANQQVSDRLKFNAYMIFHSREAWRFLTSAFVHVDFLHLVMNMYVLYMFGNSVEYFFLNHFSSPGKGILFYLILYLLGAVVSGLYSFEKHKHDLWYNAVGASGAVSAVVFASIAIAPMKEMGIIFVPGVWIPGFILGFLYLLYSWYMGRRKLDNIGHDAHFFGALFGFVYIFLLDRTLFTNFIESIRYYLTNLF